MRIAVIGTGIAGNVAAYHLAREHEITVFEAAGHIGGHTHTHDIVLGDRRYAIDTGFIVFNDRTYPNFTRLLDELGVESQPSDMSFSVRCERTGLEYNGSNVNTLFAQRRNLVRPGFYRMIRDILRFNREARNLLAARDESLTLGRYLERAGYSREFVEHYVLPMGAAIWSADPAGMRDFPACYFVRFFDNHGLLSVDQRPAWRVVKGGSRTYVERLIARHRDRIRLRAPVVRVRRLPTHVEITVANAEPQRFDCVFIASHSDQALAMLADASRLEHEVLGAIRYQENEAVLHTDESLLPRRRLAWASWNYHIRREARDRVAVTYHMNRLQGIAAPAQLCVTLNSSDAVDPEKVLRRMRYHHPVFTPAGVAAQPRQREINGIDRTYFCGAYWRYGFHEDGVVSALAAVKHLEEDIRHEQLHLRRAG